LAIREITAKTLLRKHRHMDSWFVSRCGMNLYRGCAHDCAYCDGRAEGYYVEGAFGEDVAVKTNAAALLAKELDPARRRKPLNPGFVMVGGGVGDSYQPAESTYGITRAVLEVLQGYRMPVHVLTKSALVLRDRDLLKEINQTSRAVVSVSLSSADDAAGALFEPCAALPCERLRVIAELKADGIPCGVFLMPVIPGITDTEEMLQKSLDAIEASGADFCIFGGMTLKPGRQRDHFMAVIDAHYPSLRAGYEKVYPGNRYGNALGAYYDKLNRRFAKVALPSGLALRIPDTLFGDLLDDRDRVTVILEQLDYLCRLNGRETAFGAAARTVASRGLPPHPVGGKTEHRQGIGRAAAAVIDEILETGTSSDYRSLLGKGG
jgi:DNA repair photolyase